MLYTLSVPGLENTVKLRLLAVHKIVSENAEKTLCAHGEDAKTDKLRISWFIMVQHEHFLRSFFCRRWVVLSQKTISRNYPFN
jgi:hypothetical protein